MHSVMRDFHDRGSRSNVRLPEEVALQDNWFSSDLQFSGSMHDSDSEAPSYNISRRSFPCPYPLRVPCFFSPSSTSPDPLRFTATRWDLRWPTPRNLSPMPRMTTDGQCCGSMAWS